MSREATLLAFDYGEKRIGVAVGNTLTRQARALLTLENRNSDYRFLEVGKLLDEWKPNAVVVGMPMHPDGTPHKMSALAKRFGNQVNGRFNVPVQWVDERYSSVDAKADLRERGVHTNARGRFDEIDAEAARVILQQYLDELADDHEFH
ncbi:Holliday junction resolvase RuvX [Caballeronia sp. LZ043]|uniref:Holliday junction resolvase RuvX n=1 Tax=Caballeronia sp. LZ043 TaxID=3038569 RepID=UPI002863C7AB|nr:Holliday junction resolvase RuvX [Caballeronia sp. LZ043]MDR5820817.1 Holliday junction resolvase RuvX [Caballeronia sp. LZ043]